jgi:hypothetical protein
MRGAISYQPYVTKQKKIVSDPLLRMWWGERESGLGRTHKHYAQDLQEFNTLQLYTTSDPPPLWWSLMVTQRTQNHQIHLFISII